MRDFCRSGVSRVVFTLALALLVGVGDAALKGHHGGIRDAAGNISAVWLILPLAAGAFAAPRRPVGGALAGLLSTLTALAGFYVLGRYVAGFGVGPNSARPALSLVGTLGARWLQAGAVSGLGLGAIGGWLSGSKSGNAIAAIVAAMLIFEPLAHIVYMARKGVSIGGFGATAEVWAVEAFCGLLLAAALRFERSGRRAARNRRLT